MDFFKKAHVARRESSRKEHTSEEAVKKQLKEILHGYKQHDSKLINRCAASFDANRLLDESSSVSGFSDLNLTNSSNEGDTTRGTIGSDIEHFKNSDIDEPSRYDSPSVSKDNNSSESLDLSKESISDIDDNIQTLSDNITAQVTLDSGPDISDVASLDSFEETTTDNDLDESEFDVDGVLANKIMEKLKNKGVVKKKSKKRKLEVIGCHSTKQKFIDNPITDVDEDDVSSLNTDAEINKEKESFESSVSDTNSSDFVSIAPTDMPVQSLSEIIGEYRYPTVRNLPEGQNLHTTNDSCTFSVEDEDVADISEDNDIENVDPQNISVEAELDEIDGSYLPISESMSAYDETQSEETSEKEMSEELNDVSFERSIKVFYGDASCIFVMKHPAKLYLHGKVIIKGLRGALEVFGHTLQTEPCKVYAPNYNFAFCLKTIEEERDNDTRLFSKLRSEGLTVADAEEIVTNLNEYDGIVCMKRLHNHKLDFVENYMTQTDLFSKISKNVESCFIKASEMLGCSLYLTRPYRAFEDLSCWEDVVRCGSEDQSRGIICGGKGVGKTTFLRYCVNRLLTRGPVLVVDLDPGQAEFTVAGCVSATVVDQPLLGPNYTHLKTPNMMLNLGMINTMENPRRYAAGVAALIDHCNSDEQLKSMPWLINTMGMCNSLGLKFMAKIIIQAKPTYLVQINTRNPKKRFDTLLNPKNIKDLYEANFHYDDLFKNVRYPQDLDYAFFVENHSDNSPKNAPLSPRDERYLNFLAYFSELIKSRHNTGLLGITPYEVKLEDLYIGWNIKVPNDAVAKVINGKIMALCQLTSFDNARKVFTLKDKPLLCHGHGLIRGIDFERGILYIVTPTPMEKLSLVDTLVYGDWVPELRGQERHLPNDITIPYRTATMYQKRQLMFAPKRRFNPLQLLKMTRNS